MKKIVRSLLFFLLEHLNFSLHQVKEICVQSGTVFNIFSSKIIDVNTLTLGPFKRFIHEALFRRNYCSRKNLVSATI